MAIILIWAWLFISILCCSLSCFDKSFGLLSSPWLRWRSHCGNAQHFSAYLPHIIHTVLWPDYSHLGTTQLSFHLHTIASMYLDEKTFVLESVGCYLDEKPIVLMFQVSYVYHYIIHIHVPSIIICIIYSYSYAVCPCYSMLLLLFNAMATMARPGWVSSCPWPCVPLPCWEGSMPWIFEISGSHGQFGMGWLGSQNYPLVNVYITLGNHHV